MSGRVFSIGHGGRSLDALVAELRRLEVPYLIDVRSAPYSRFQPAFSKGPLEEELGLRQIRYVYMGDALGGRPSDPDCYDAEGKVDYARCRTKERFVRGIERLCTAHAKGMRVCLLCAEGKPSQCHRAKLIGAALLERGLEVEHVLPDGTIRTQSELLAEPASGQGELFGARRGPG